MFGRPGFTMTSKNAVAVFPAASVALTCSRVVPTGNVSPLAFGVTLTAPATPLRLSDALTENVTLAPALEVACDCTWNGKDRFGAVLSILMLIA